MILKCFGFLILELNLTRPCLGGNTMKLEAIQNSTIYDDGHSVNVVVTPDGKHLQAEDLRLELISALQECALLRRVIDKISYRFAIKNHHDQGELRGKLFADKFIAQERVGILDDAIISSLALGRDV
jgi:hypothetical protein